MSDMPGRDANPTPNVEAPTLAGLIERAPRIVWLILNRSESNWDGKVRAIRIGGSTAAGRNDIQTTRR